MFTNNNLKEHLLTWRNRISKSSFDQFPNQISYFIKNIEKETKLISLINRGITNYKIDDDFVKNWFRNYGVEYLFKNEEQQAACCFYALKFIIEKNEPSALCYMAFLGERQCQSEYIENFIDPIIEYLGDNITKASAVLYLIEKYKKRVEWFTKRALLLKYRSAEKQYEDIFEDDLRLFLFDQGVEYPFSTPKSASGRVDVVGLIETNDPLIVEIKIFDKEKNYGKTRIISGLTQILKYCNDYVKDVGYLVIFNLETIEIDFKMKNMKNKYPPRLLINGITIYFYVINIAQTKPASKIGKSTVLSFTEEELLDYVNK